MFAAQSIIDGVPMLTLLRKGNDGTSVPISNPPRAREAACNIHTYLGTCSVVPWVTQGEYRRDEGISKGILIIVADGMRSMSRPCELVSVTVAVVGQPLLD